MWLGESVFTEPFELELFPADAVRFIPMDFCTSDSTILELDLGQTLSLLPVPAPIPPFQMIETTDGAAHRNRLNVLDV